ncbi:MAG: HEPN domain-containing protein [Thaumarchaeota archaeon]|nr:HEPN domain-containing protein [Nitrososphaerota archaeon]
MLLDRGEYPGAVSRTYYAIFHTTRAILYSQGTTAKTHSGLVSLITACQGAPFLLLQAPLGSGS